MKWLLKDWKIKLVSLFLAIGLWYYAVGEESVELKRIIPLEISVKNPQMSILKASTRNIWVTFAAPRNVVSDLTEKDIRARHDVAADINTAGDYTFRLEPRDIKVPTPQVKVTRIIPETVRVTLDELIAQKLEIKPSFSGEPAFGYTIRNDEIEIDPNAILLEGPKGQLEKLDFVTTKEIDLIGRIRSFRRTVELQLPASVKPLSEAVVDIFIPIKEEFGEKKFEDIPVKLLFPSDVSPAVNINPGRISFVLKGSVQRLEKLLPEKILAYVDLTDVRKSQEQVPVTLVLPDEVSLKNDVFVAVDFLKTS